MRQTYYSSWINSNLLLVVGAIGVLYVSMTRSTHYNLFGLLVSMAIVLWVVYGRYTTYVYFGADGSLVNSEGKIVNHNKISISSILYVVRTQYFVFSSWGGCAMIFYRADNGTIVQTSIIESSYSHETLRDILRDLIKTNPQIELDEEYTAFISESDPGSSIQLKSTSPHRSMKEVEAYVSSQYGKS